MQYKELLDSLVSEWGPERDVYLVSVTEFIVLMQSGIRPQKLDESNDDGTYVSTIIIEGKTFCCSGEQQVGGVL